MPPSRITLPGHLIPALKNAHPLGDLAPQQILHLSIGLRLRNRSALDALLLAQDNPTSHLFHHYLSPPQFADQYGPLPSITKVMTDFLLQQGFQIESVSPNHALIVASASASHVKQAFAVHIATFNYAGRTVYAPTNEPSLPASLAGIVQGIVGLDDVAQWHHAPSLPQHHAFTYQNTFPKDSGGCIPLGFGPEDFYHAYDISSLVNNTYNGANQNVAILEFDGENASDVDVFDQCYGLPALTSQAVTLPFGPTSTVAGVRETDLDMEVLHEIAPGATEIVYMAENNPSYGVDAFDYIVNDTTYSPHIVSNSNDLGCESDIGQQEIEQLDTVFAQGASEGIAFFTSSNDYGAYDCNLGASLGVGVPASDPHVVAVGGTQFPNNATTSPEVAWDNTQYQQSSGGGISTVFTTPPYQQAITLWNHRAIPDVAADAENYAEYCSVVIGGKSCGGWIVNGGTSASTPLWAGIAADSNSYLSARGVTLGSASSLLYQMQRTHAADFHDVYSGCDYTNSYCASNGYDLVTGLGSPDAWKLGGDLYAWIGANIESQVVWGTFQNGTVDLIAAENKSDNPGWQLTNVSQIIRGLTGESLSLQTNDGSPALVSYPTYGSGTENDVFALATAGGQSALYGFAYVAKSDTWSDLGAVITSGLPVRNPVGVAFNAPSPTQTVVALFGVASNNHLMEYWANNHDRATNGQPIVFQSLDLSASFGLTCDPGVVPAATVYNSVPVVFADCGDQLIEFYADTNHAWHVNTGIVGNHIPNASHAFPGHSLAAMVVPGNPASLEAYVASDRNGVSVLSEYLYNGSWHNNTVPLLRGHTPDQLMAQTFEVATPGSPVAISEVFASDPATTSCTSLPLAVQYLYQPQLQNPQWQGTVLPSTNGRGITDMTSLVEQNNTVFTQAYTGGYTGTGTPGVVGGGGCTSAGQPIYENYSDLSSNATQTWKTPVGIDTGAVENAGVDPVGIQFPY